MDVTGEMSRTECERMMNRWHFRKFVEDTPA